MTQTNTPPGRGNGRGYRRREDRTVPDTTAPHSLVQKEQNRQALAAAINRKTKEIAARTQTLNAINKAIVKISDTIKKQDGE